MQMSGAELDTVPSSVFRLSFWKKKEGSGMKCSVLSKTEILELLQVSFLQDHRVTLDDHWQTYLKVIVGAAECRLD